MLSLHGFLRKRCAPRRGPILVVPPRRAWFRRTRLLTTVRIAAAGFAAGTRVRVVDRLRAGGGNQALKWIAAAAEIRVWRTIEGAVRHFGLSCTFSGSPVSREGAESWDWRPRTTVSEPPVDARGEDTRLRVSTSSAQAPPCAHPRYSESSSASKLSPSAASTSTPLASSWMSSRPGRSPAAGSAASSADRSTTAASDDGGTTTSQA